MLQEFAAGAEGLGSSAGHHGDGEEEVDGNGGDVGEEEVDCVDAYILKARISTPTIPQKN